MNSRILIAGTHSGCGKTTVTLALLSALQARGHDLAPFKCGPDYIDPMFHRAAAGVPGGTLDPFFSSGEELCAALAGQKGRLCVVEGAMGYYDGVGPEGRFSAYDVARETQTPVILVVNVKGMYTSAGALLRGFQQFRPQSNVRGVIFNGASAGLYEGLERLAQDAGLLPLGLLPYEKAFSIESRSLGLVAAGEICDLGEKLRGLGTLAERWINLDGVLALAASAPDLPVQAREIAPGPGVRLAVARDRAFCFLYEETLALFRALGCELCFFSPLQDKGLPEGTGALYLPGGYPALHLGALSENTAMRHAVRSAVEGGLPTLAEGGGFLYLHEQLDGLPLAGVIRAKAYKTGKLQRFGYGTLTAKRPNLLCQAGESIPMHEFHDDKSSDQGDGFEARKPDGRAWDCVHASESLVAGFPQLYLPANVDSARRLTRKAWEYAVKHAK